VVVCGFSGIGPNIRLGDAVLYVGVAKVGRVKRQGVWWGCSFAMLPGCGKELCACSGRVAWSAAVHVAVLEGQVRKKRQ